MLVALNRAEGIATFADTIERTAKRSWNRCIVSFAVRPIVAGVVAGHERMKQARDSTPEMLAAQMPGR
jgi:hypothetical protein